MAYRDDVLALNPDHFWRLDGDLNDSVGSLNGTTSGGTLFGTAQCEDATNAFATQSTSAEGRFAATASLTGALDRKVVCGWFSPTQVQGPPVSVYKESLTGTYQFALILWAGNNLMLNVDNAGTIIQAFSDEVLRDNRPTHVFLRVEGTGFGNKVEMYIDGVKQSLTEPANGDLGTATLEGRTGGAVFGDSVNIEIGGVQVLCVAAVNGRYNFWAAFSGANAQLTDTEIREELFEKGALADFTITSGTQAAMQTQLDTIADTVRPDWPCCIRVEANTGDTDFTLVSDNVTFDELASIHVQYMGTGTLTWRNTNGSDASIVSTPNGGSVNIQNDVTLTINNLQNPTEVRVYAAGTQTELAGQEDVTTGTFSASLSDSLVDIAIASLDFQNQFLRNVDTSSDVTLQVTQFNDIVYVNPA
jgi:hypothetical protein